MKRKPVLAAVFLCLSIVPASFASSPDETVTPQPQSNEASTAWSFAHAKMVTGAALKGTDIGAAEGMRVAIDPQTGELRQPTTEELQALDSERSQQRLRRIAVNSVPVERPDGTVMMAVDEELLNYSLGSISANGMQFRCVEGHSNADVQVPAAAPAREEK